MADVPRAQWDADGRVLPGRSAGFPLPKRGLMSTLGSGAQGAAAGLLGMPVDMMSMLTNPILRMIGLNPGTPVGGTESIGSLLGADVQSLPFTVGSMLPFSPGDAMMGAAPFVARAAGKLDMSTPARMERAREMGFDVDRPVFHGTSADIDAFDPALAGSATKARSAKLGTWVVDDPNVAGGYARFASEDVPVQRLIDQSYAAESRGDFDAAENIMRAAEQLEQSGELVGAGGQNLLRLNVRGNFMEVDAKGATFGDIDDGQLTRWAQQAKAQDKDGLRVKNLSDNVDHGVYTPADHTLVFDPANIRSTNATFDPAQSNSSNLLAGVAGAGIGTAMLAPQGAEAQQQPPADMETLLRILRELGIQ